MLLAHETVVPTGEAELWQARQVWDAMSAPFRDVTLPDFDIMSAVQGGDKTSHGNAGVVLSVAVQKPTGG